MSAANMIEIVCAWCGKRIGEKQADNLPPGSVSHGICPDCYKKQMEQLPKPQPAPVAAVMLALLVWLPLVFGGPATSSVACGVADWPPCGEVQP